MTLPISVCATDSRHWLCPVPADGMEHVICCAPQSAYPTPGSTKIRVDVHHTSVKGASKTNAIIRTRTARMQSQHHSEAVSRLKAQVLALVSELQSRGMLPTEGVTRHARAPVRVPYGHAQPACTPRKATGATYWHPKTEHQATHQQPHSSGP